MYLEYWRFKEKPFNNAIDPRFVYYSSHHKEALLRLYYTVQEKKGIGVLTGELGSGKTLLTQILFNRLLKEGRYKAILITNPCFNSAEFIEEIIYQVEGERVTLDKKHQLLHKLEEALLLLKEHMLHPVVIVDETQIIKDPEVFEQLRLLYNYQKDGSFLLTLILAGQPELREKIDSLPAFKQRIALSYHLPALSRDETANYILHRCSVAGRQDSPFSDDGVESVFGYAQGIPRKINLLCDLALLQGYHLKKERIDRDAVEEIVSSIEYV